MGPPRAMLGMSTPPRHGRPACAAAPMPGELAAGRAPPRGSIVAAAAQHRARPGPGWAWMRARSTSSPSDLRRPMVLVAPPSCVVCRSDMHVHDHCLPPCCSIQLNGQERICFSSQRTQGATLYHHQKFFDWKSSYCRISRQSISTSVNASGQQLQSEPEAHDSTSIWRAISSSLDAFYRFSRPHTVIGTALSIVSVSLLAVQSLSDISPLFLTGLLEAVVAALFMNIYIVGLNQLFDIEIDKVNKPTLPLASGEYTPATGVAIVSVFAAMSFGLGWAVGSQPLFWALFISFILGTAYSINLPYLRWKRFAVVAALCILAVRAVIVQLAFFLHIQTFVFRRPAVFSRPLIFATGFMTFFSVVIALFKDIPDIEGDRIFGIRSFSVRLGQKKRCNTDGSYFFLFVEQNSNYCWPFHTCCDLMELRAIGGPDEQSRNNILLHVHLEAVLRGVPAHPSGAVRRVEAMRWIGECRGRGRGNNSTGQLECWSKLPFES